MTALSFDDVTLIPRYNDIPSRKDVDTSVQFGDLELKIPIFSSNMDTVTGFKMAREIYKLGGLGFLHRFCSIEDNISMYKKVRADWIDQCRPGGGFTVIKGNDSGSCEAIVSLGVNEGLDRFHALYEVGARYFCIDIAHGHSESVGALIQQIKEFDSNTYVVAGNVCHAAGAEYLADKGADAIKIGIGPGSVCSTRVKTGFGVPQFQALLDCSRVNVFKIADGGIRTPGDAVKAFVAGADAVMIGGMFAGCDETPGEVLEVKDETDVIGAYAASTYSKINGLDYSHLQRSLGRFKTYRGMASREAAEDHFGRQADWKTAEGVEIKVPAKGPVSTVIADLMGGIRSGMCYCGANNLKQIQRNAAWVEITTAGQIEGTPHGQ